MPNLIQDVISGRREAAAESRREAAEVCRAILLRNEDPKPGDDEALGGAMQVLGIEPDDLPAYLKLVERLAQCEKLASKYKRLEAALHHAQNAFHAHEQHTQQAYSDLKDKLAAERVPLETAANRAKQKYDEARAARAELPALQDAWQVIVTDNTPEEVRAARLAQVPRPDGVLDGPDGPA